MRIGGRIALLLTACGVLVACGGGSNGGGQGPPDPSPVDTDYSNLLIPAASDGLRAPRSEEELLVALRNGVRLSLAAPEHVFTFATAVTSPSADGAPSYSRTTSQVDGVDEADLVKYDGTHLFIVRPEPIAETSVAPYPPMTRNILSIVRTSSVNATTQPVSTFTLDEEQTELPLIYSLENETGRTELLTAVSHDASFWRILATTSTLIAPIERVENTSRVQLLDVSDPYNVRQTWKLEIDGGLRTSRKVGDVLYVVTSFHPTLLDIVVPASTPEEREANERRIRSAGNDELLPHYRIDDGREQPLVRASSCVVGAELQDFHAYDHLLVITAINLRERRITDAACLSTNASGVYMSRSSLYFGGEHLRSSEPGVTTVLHKFALANGDIAYAASGAVEGRVGWTNPAYYMDERDDDLRILTSQWSGATPAEHRLSILRQTGSELSVVATLPNDARPSEIGKPGETVHSVRFVADFAYVVTARRVDPFYAIDLSDPSDPFIAGELEIPGFSTYLHPLGSSLVASVGQHTTDQGVPRGVKVELFDVSEPEMPRSVGVQVFGDSGSMSEAVFNPHAVAFVAAASDSYRMALPIDVFETPDPNWAGSFTWTYSGLHVLEIGNASSGSPRLDFQGVIRTNEPSAGVSDPPYVVPQRGVLHDDSVFFVYGESVASRTWQDLARSPSTGMQF